MRIYWLLVASNNTLVCIESCKFFFAGAILFSTEDICILSCLQPSCFTSFYFLIFHPLVILLTPYSAPLSPFQVRVSRLITLKWGNSFCKKFPIRLTWQLWDACYKADAICWGGNWTRQCSLSQKHRCNLVSNQSSAVVIGQQYTSNHIWRQNNCRGIKFGLRLWALLGPKMGCINFQG